LQLLEERAILDALEGVELSSLQLERLAGLAVKRLYPALGRLERLKIIEARWGESVGSHPKSPLPRLYRRVGDRS
jgi:hypothetical protein